MLRTLEKQGKSGGNGKKGRKRGTVKNEWFTVTTFKV
jgi:hypothetical protein